VIGPLYESSLAGLGLVEVERADGSRRVLEVAQWMGLRPGDDSLLSRCAGPTLDIGSGPGRLTVALAERGIPALGIDITPYAVKLTWASGGLALVRDVFGHVPGGGRWSTVLLADGNIGIGGEPVALLRRAAELLAPRGRVLVEVEGPGHVSGSDRLRLRRYEGRHEGACTPGPWFRWAYVGCDDIASYARAAGLRAEEIWTEARRWFAALCHGD
jgi:SAM-dependent methyltransferase